MGEQSFRDRETLVTQEQERYERDAQAAAVEALTQYRTLGLGLAVFCEAFYDALALTDPETPPQARRFDRTEVLQLLHIALQGR